MDNHFLDNHFLDTFNIKDTNMNLCRINLNNQEIVPAIMLKCRGGTDDYSVRQNLWSHIKNHLNEDVQILKRKNKCEDGLIIGHKQIISRICINSYENHICFYGTWDLDEIYNMYGLICNYMKIYPYYVNSCNLVFHHLNY